MNGNPRCNSHNDRARIAESYNTLYSYFSSNEIRQVGNYTIIKLIGEGAFGKVYLANHTLTHSKVVLKSGLKDDPNLVREVYYHRQFKHPNITRLYEVVVAEGKIWMVLEYCPGKELYDYVLSCGRVDVDEGKKLFAQVASSVYYAHSMNCIHRDLKLENILLDKKRNAKLSDFGFTREYEARSLLETVCGTTVYMAPELLQKKKYDGFKVDVWSLGIILYTMLYGQMPFDEEDEMMTQYKIVNEEPIYRNDVPQDAINLIQRLLQKSPVERPTLFEIMNDQFLETTGPAEIESSNALLRSLASTKSFNTKTEKYLLKKLKSLGIDTHALKKSVIARNCDPLTGLWELLLEKHKRSEVKKYKARSRSVLRISESTSRRVSLFMEGSPAISRIVSQVSNNTNTGTGGGGGFLAAGGGSAGAGSFYNQPLAMSNYPPSIHNTFIDDNCQHNSSTANLSPEKKKSGFMSKITKLWKKKDHDESNPLHLTNSRFSNGSQVYPADNLIGTNHQQDQQQQPSNANVKMISFSKTSHSRDQPLQDQKGVQSEQLAAASLQLPQQKELRRLSKPAPFQSLQQDIPEGANSSTQQPTLTIKEPRSPTRKLQVPSRPRPNSVLSQHSLASQYTTKSDVSIADSNITLDSRPPFMRKVSSDTSLQSKGGTGNTTRRSLSILSNNSSTSERSSRRSSIYEISPTGGSSALGEFQLKNSMQQFPRGRGRSYNEGAIFPKSFRRRKSPLGGTLLSGSKFKRSKTLIIEEEEDDDINDDDEVADDEGVYEDMDGIETDLENLAISESTRKSSDFESDLNEERGRSMVR